MSAAAVIIIITPRPARMVNGVMDEQTTDHRKISVSGLYADPTNGEVAAALQEALDTFAELDPDEAWSGS
jgi:hypothetical protein